MSARNIGAIITLASILYLAFGISVKAATCSPFVCRTARTAEITLTGLPAPLPNADGTPGTPLSNTCEVVTERNSVRCNALCQTACQVFGATQGGGACASSYIASCSNDSGPSLADPAPTPTPTPTPAQDPASIQGADVNCGRSAAATRRTNPNAAISSDIADGWVCAMPRNDGERGRCRPYSSCSAWAGAACCPAGVGGPLSQGTPSAPPAPPGVPGRFNLPTCATTHDAALAGKCTLDDIVQVGVTFANFLMGLAAAFFLAIFVWAGCKYIFFAYDPGVAGDAKKTLTNAAIGMLLVLGASVIIRFVQTAATGSSAPPVPAAATSKTANPSSPAAGTPSTPQPAPTR